MGNMDSWDVTLLIVAGYVAVTSLVRLMARRRRQLIDDLEKQADEEHWRKKADEAAENRKRQSA